MNESSFEIVIDVLAREIDMLRYQLKAAGKENEGFHSNIKDAESRNKYLSNRVQALEEENAKLRAIIEEGHEKHE